MKTAYRILAYLVAAEVVLQAAVITLAVVGLSNWVDSGGVYDKALRERHQAAFPEAVAFAVHGINGQLLVPVIALLLLIVSLFAKVSGGVKWAAVVFVLVIVQVALGMLSQFVAALGALHGINAMALFAAAIYAARRRPVKSLTASEVVEPLTPLSKQA